MVWFVVLILLVSAIWLHTNCKELLKVIKDKDQVIDANIRSVTQLEGQYLTALETMKDMDKRLKEVDDRLIDERIRNNSVLSQKKSNEVRMGAIAENCLPFMKDIPYDCKNLHHLAQPIDFIYFNYEDKEITFVEVKSGKAKESKRQKLISDIIKNKNVHYELVQVTEEGLKVTRKF